MKDKLNRFTSWTVAVWFFFIGTAAPLRAEPPTPAIIIFDGSGSMWGELAGDKAQKLETARAALRPKLESLSADARVGFMSFGHRRKGNCSDIEVIAAPQAGIKDQLLNALDTLDPKGKGPITATLKEAFKLVGKERQATIILIHDGVDNCGQDPCAAAAEIAALNANIRIHTISLSLERPDAQRMQCLAKATRGQSFNASDAGSVTAAIAEALKLAALDSGAPDIKETVEPPSPPSAAPEAQHGKSGLRLSASLAEGGPDVSMPLLWRIFKDGDDAKPIIERIAAQVSEDLPPGKYTIEAQLGLAVARGPAEVSSSEPTVIKVPMRAGTLKLTVPGQPSHAPLPEALLTLWRKENGAESTAAADSSPIWLGRGNDNELTVPEGTYLIRLESGLADPIQEVQVKAGEETRVGFDLSFGRLDLSASIAEGAPPISDVSFIVHEDDPDAPQGRREITRTAHPGPSFSLPSGTYYVTAKTSRNEVRQRIAIGKGDLVKKNIVVGLTRLDVNTVLENGSLPANTLVLHRVLSIEAEPKELARETGLDVSFQLASGRYRVETAIGSENVKVTSDVELQPGRDAKISARVQAARLTVKPSAAASADSVWEVRDQQGMLIARLKSAEGRTALLAPGRYSLRSASRDQRLDKFLELKAGETRTIELAAP